ncbi:hypothetical protein F4780DRAFT_730134 [Xylariomycetidae sp. FL0641]|nr:hypothetical protein F4780DRAFT_730134 [Xylariomycetidae sp. FL0641]
MRTRQHDGGGAGRPHRLGARGLWVAAVHALAGAGPRGSRAAVARLRTPLRGASRCSGGSPPIRRREGVMTVVPEATRLGGEWEVGGVTGPVFPREATTAAVKALSGEEMRIMDVWVAVSGEGA